MNKLTEFIKSNRRIINLAVVLFIFFAGFYFGSKSIFEKKHEIYNNTTPNTTLDLESFWKTWNAINEKYPNAKEISDKQKLEGAVAGLVNSLEDPYSVFFNEEESKSFEEDIAGNFSGVGMEVGIKDKVLTVISPLKGTPAYQAGIKSGDKILKIDDTLTNDLTIDKAVKLIRGEKGTPVTLTVLSTEEQEPKEFKIVRDVINVPTLETELRNDGIFVIKLYSFSANSADLFRNAMKSFSKSKTDKLLLDLRGNPGGYLDSAVDMASWFLDNGKVVVIEDYGNSDKQKSYRSFGYNIFNDNLKFVILIDGGSASASEILAGAMQDHKKAKLVGEQSFGKGSVQEVLNITDKTLLKITVAKWLTPNGNSISKKGLTPDYKVEITKKDLESKKDTQMDKAVELLNNWPASE